MARKLLFLLAILPLLLGGGCLSSREDTTTMSVKLTWLVIGDCDLRILEPDNNVYYAVSYEYPSSSPNGRFSANSPSGGPETWTLNKYHQPGQYKPLVYNWSSTNEGTINIEITINGITGSGTELIKPNELLQFLDYSITRNPSGDNQLQYTLVRKKINELPPNGPS